MALWDTIVKIGKGAFSLVEGMADKASEMKIKAQVMQEEEMVDKSNKELKKIASSSSGVRGYAARLELKARGLL